MTRRWMLATSFAWFAACGFDWAAYDPRGGVVGGVGGDGAGVGGQGGMLTAGGGEAGGGVGGAGGSFETGEVVCALSFFGWTRGIAGYPDGGFVVVGDIRDVTTLGGEPLVSAGENDALVARFGPQCEHVFSLRVGATAADSGEGMALAPNGDIVVTGSFGLTVELGSLEVTSVGAQDAFVARLSPGGEFLWATPYGGPGDEWGRAVAVDPAGNVYAAGRFQQTIDVVGPLTSAGADDGIVIKLDPSGQPLWSRQLASSSTVHIRSIAVAPSGQILLVGRHGAPLTVDGTTIPHLGSRDAFLLALDESGHLAWWRAFASSGHEYAQALAIAPSGLVVAGRFDTSLELDGIALTSKGGRDIFLAGLDATGEAQWARGLGGVDDGDRGSAVAVDGLGAIALGGAIRGESELGGGLVGTVDEESLYAALYESNGDLAWASVFPATGSNYSRGLAIAFAENGDLLLGGFSNGLLDLGGRAVTQGFAVRIAR